PPLHYPSPASYCSCSSFPRHADHRPLHSFPTRRSSDLRPAPQPTPTQTSLPLPADVTPVQPAAVAAPAPIPTTTSEPAPATVSPDRKSTRLNSSHVKISYAVFCLKKKTNRSKSYNTSIG